MAKRRTRRRSSRRKSSGGLGDTNNIALLLLVGMIGFVFFSQGEAQVPNYDCPYCDLTFPDQASLDNHIASFHTYPTPTPTPYPTPTPTVPPSGSGILYTGFAEDYLRTFSDAPDPIAEWDQSWYTTHLDYWGDRGYNSMRLGFNFGSGEGSHYSETKMDAVVNWFYDSHGYKAIFDMHDNSPSIYGSQGFVDNWRNVASHYAGNGKVAGFNIANEPALGTTLNPLLYASSGPTGQVTINYELTKYFVYVTQQIRSIDPTRVVFFPTYVMYRPEITFNTWHSYLLQAGSELNYNVIADPYVIFDVTHPYYFENIWDGGMTPEEKAQWYVAREVLPAVTAFGSAKCWSGETFAGWYPGVYDDNGVSTTIPATYDLQYRWLKAIINQFDVYNVPFTVGWAISNGEIRGVNEASMTDSTYFD